MRCLVLGLLVFPFAASAQSADPFPVTFLPGGAQAEGCFAQWSTRSAIRAHSAPTPVSEHIRTIDADRRIDANDYSESLTTVLRKGLVRARQSVEFEAFDVRTQRTSSVRLSPDEEVDVLGSAGEGAVYFAHSGGVLVGFLPGMYSDGGETERVREPIVEVWVRLIEHGADRPAAWVNVSQAGMAPREDFCL